MMNCMKCGDCMAVCPTFGVTGDEGSTARGRLRLIKAFEDSELEITDRFIDKINSCMMCQACNASCPSGVEIGDIIISTREKIAKERGLSTYRRMVNAALVHPSIMKIASLVAPVLKPVLKNKMPLASGGTFSGTSPEVQNPKMRVAFFAGCMVNYGCPEIGDAVLGVLGKNDIEVILEKEKCCSAPALFSGDMTTAKHLAEDFVERFSTLDVDAIITCCPTCETAIKGYQKILEGNEKAGKVAEKVCDLSSFLVNAGIRGGHFDGQIGYHPSCHLKYGAGSEDEMKIISSLQKEELKELEGCCGFAGMFSASYPGLSKSVSEKKLDDIEAAGVGTIVTGCPGCKMYMEKGLNRRGINCKVMHTAELMEEACE